MCVYAGTDPLTGKMRYLRETAKTYGAAEVLLTRLQGQVDENQHPKSAITVRQAIVQWLEVVELEVTTRERYDDLIRLYILPTLGNLQASKLDAELLERYYARLHRCRDLCSGRARAGHACRPLSSSTTRKIHYIIRGALERAVRWQHLGVNKAAMATAPSPRPAEPDPPSAAEAVRLLNESWSDPEWCLLLWLTMVTGSRRGEVSALRWRDIDFVREIVWVHRSNAQTKAGVVEKETKTGQRRGRSHSTPTRWAWCASIATSGSSVGRTSAALSTMNRSSSPPAPTGPCRTRRGLSRRGTAGWRQSCTCGALGSTRCATTRRQSLSRLASTFVPSLAGLVTAAAGHHAEGVLGLGRRGGPSCGGHYGRHHAQAGGVRERPRGPYEVIATALRGDILAGRLAAGAQLPTVVDLAAAHRVAAGTAHRAIALLNAEGLIEVTRGRRAIVVNGNPSPLNLRLAE